jgi:hypothetical protein
VDEEAGFVEEVEPEDAFVVELDVVPVPLPLQFPVVL